MNRIGRTLLRLSRAMMLMAALCFAAQGIGTAYAAALDAEKSGPVVWHVHEDEDGTRHVHAHPAGDDGSHHDHDGNLKCCAAHGVSALPALDSAAVVAPESAARKFAGVSMRFPSGQDPGGLRRPPRTPSIG